MTALRPVVAGHEGAWVGWAWHAGPAAEPFELDGIRLHPVALSESDLEDFYEGQSNSTIWPLYHDAVETPIYSRRLARGVPLGEPALRRCGRQGRAEGATVWVHDYQLQLVPAMLRELRPGSADRLLPAHPVPADRAVHADAAARGDPAGPARGRPRRLPAEARGAELRPARPPPARAAVPAAPTLDVDGRTVKAGAFPISIDASEMEATRGDAERAGAGEGDPGRAGQPEDVHPRRRPARLHQGHRAPPRGVPRAARGRGAERARDGAWCRSRRRAGSGSSTTRRCATRVEREVGRINGEFGRVGMPAVHYLHQSYEPRASSPRSTAPPT